ncbi:MAG: peptidyl-prolyl cis-trans isomerase [Xanthomonadales bacterium]|nr:peptidyl-prolyl cis-trans isomerase [Xanthomonadales bacterium]
MIRNLLLAAALALPLAAAAQDADPQVVLRTTMGDITLELDKRSAPVTVDNFLKYVQAGHYDGTIFHRVIDNFMIQGGGYTTELTGKGTRAAIMNEAPNGLKNTRGTIAMARTADPHSATAQFFINVVDNPALDHIATTDSRSWGYAVFGKVVSGMDVVDAIKAVPTRQQGMMENLPVEPVLIEKAELVGAQAGAEAGE